MSGAAASLTSNTKAVRRGWYCSATSDRADRRAPKKRSHTPRPTAVVTLASSACVVWRA